MDTIEKPKVKKPRKAPVRKRVKKVAEPIAPTVSVPTETSPIAKAVDPHDRKVLSEGRSYGIGFAYGKLEGDTVTTVGPRSPCKDYLNDQTYSEWTGKPYRAWGYNAKKEGLFEEGKPAYIVFSILPQKYGESYATQEKETKFLNDNPLSVQKFLNTVEEMLKVTPTKIIKTGDNMFVAVIEKFWFEFPYRISLWSLLTRFAVESFWKDGDVMEAIKNAKTCDASFLATALPKINRLIKGERPTQDYSNSSGWHDAGIISVSF